MNKVVTVLAASLFVVLGASLPASAAPYCGITWGSQPKVVETYSTNPLTNIRTGRHDCYDRMVFDLRGGTAGYRVQYVTNVYADGSGQLIPLSGGAKLQIVALAPAYDINTGQTTYPGVVGKKLPGVKLSGYQTFHDAKYAGSFEGQTTVGLGVRARLPFRVLTLDNRIVVDVAHNW
jgi:hypothetical protein